MTITMERSTRETEIRLSLEPGNVATGDSFLDHMLTTFSRYASVPLRVEASGDLRHHLVEDVALVLGAALRASAPDQRARYGHAVVPMDDALVEITLDAGDRSYYRGRLPSPLYEHFLRSLAMEAGWTLHVRVLRGRDRHHIVEAAVKALGFTVRQALQPRDDVFSTKGPVCLRTDTC